MSDEDRKKLAAELIGLLEIAPAMSAQQREHMPQEIADSFPANAMRDVMIELYAEHYTEQQLVAEKDRFNALVAENASMKTKLKTSKIKQSAPAPPPAPPQDLSGLEFEVGEIIRGPNGIASAKIRLARTN